MKPIVAVAKSDVKVQSLLQAFAKSCFHKLPRNWLQRLEKHLGLPEAQPGLHSTLVGLLNHILNPSQEELVSILEIRLSRQAMEAACIQLLATEGVNDALEPSDAKDNKKMRKNMLGIKRTTSTR